MEYIIFYSWQSDLPNRTNRGFIQAALSAAVEGVESTNDIHVTPMVERDTLNRPGAPDIAQTIFEKIDKSKIFVCDVSLVNGECGRATPNPNVLVELGYAKKALGADRLILVMNTAYGAVESLPFDLRMRRVNTYFLPAEQSEKSEVRKALTAQLKSQIINIIRNESRQPTVPLSESIQSVIESQLPSQGARIRAFNSQILSRLEEIAPDLATSELDAAKPALLTAIENTVEIVGDFAKVAKTIAAMNAVDAATALCEFFSPLADHYNTPRGFSGSVWYHQFDFYRFVGHELFVSMFAPLIEERRWELISDILHEGIYIQNTQQGSPGFVDFEYLSRPVELLDRLSIERLRVSLHADILNERHAAGALSQVVPVNAFQDADLFLFLRSIVQEEKDSPAKDWYPWSFLYLGDRIPRFLAAAEVRKPAEQLATVLGAPDVETLRQRLSQRLPRIGQIFRRSHGYFPFSFRVNDIGTR